VADEHDKVRPGLLQSASGDWYFPGLLRPDEVSEQIPGLTVPDDPAYETVGGYVMSQLGRIAIVGDVVEAGGGTLAVTRMDGRRIDRICFHPAAPDTHDDEDDKGTAESDSSGWQSRKQANKRLSKGSGGSAGDAVGNPVAKTSRRGRAA
jgi:hypothetical protein